ncbi:ABC transporter permease [Natrialba asiatica]|nr:FtsX-like permease family protein [Natrialba asiatica]
MDTDDEQPPNAGNERRGQSRDERRTDEFSGRGTNRTRWVGLGRLAVTRLWKRTTKTTSRRVIATISAVALTIALLVVVTGVALALADGGTTTENDADVQVTPESTDLLSSINGVEGARLGEANERAASIRAGEGVDHATPVLTEPMRLERAGEGGTTVTESNETDANATDNRTATDPQTILLVGVTPDEEPRTVAGLPTNELAAESNAAADDTVTTGTNATAAPGQRELVLSTTAAERLGVTAGDELAVSSSQFEATDTPPPTVTVTAVAETSGDDETPVALGHLRALQTLSGASEGELADRVLVWGESDAAADEAAAAYPDATVETPDRTDPSLLFDDGLAFVTSVLALVVGVAICAAFVATTAGMTVNEDRRMLAVLESVGFPTHSRLAIVAISTQALTLCGALLGGVLGFVGIHALNAVASGTIAPGAIAETHPLFLPYALVIACVAGLIAIPYPLVIAARTSVLAEVSR